jgi:GNAT superfamily N-acetyltransferase
MPTIRQCHTDGMAAIFKIINSAARRYQGVIPPDSWHEPYMTSAALASELDAGVEFWGAHSDGLLTGVMGIQRVLDATLIRHAYVLPEFQGRGIGGQLLEHLCGRTAGTVLIGTWAAADWAIGFYTSHGFSLVSAEEARKLLHRYWTVPEDQIAASVVLRRVGAPSSSAF